MAVAQPTTPTEPPPTNTVMPAEKTGRLIVREKNGFPIRVLIDGVDRGITPLTLDLPPRNYEVSGIASTVVAAAQQISLQENQRLDIELEAVPAMARVKIHTSDGHGTIQIDGRTLAEGAYEGELPVGEHIVRVERDGFEPWEKTIQLAHQQVIVEAVTLDRKADVLHAHGASHRVKDGLYGGFHVGLALMPAGADSTLDTGCASIGATECESSKPWGLGLQGYLGYSLEPLGFELLLGTLGDYANPKAHFDGKHGSSVNPLVAQPAREEEFEIFRAGVLGAIRVRGSVDIAPVRLTGALGAGLSWKMMGMTRSVTTTDGSNGTNRYLPDAVSYWSPGVTMDLGGQFMIGETTTVSAGVWFWAETASDKARTQSESKRVIVSPQENTPPRPIATPAYDLANGAQLFVGPYLGMQFGP
ncbi:MAG: PEGA domain protein [Deltaproteobacteria bacterium ADurb.Bin207]|jgi:hypothetical protein|nr:MAG: PEGA domain protein [Deltaproteobacteria bacterium ADurb.Bin207]